VVVDVVIKKFHVRYLITLWVCCYISGAGLPRMCCKKAVKRVFVMHNRVRFLNCVILLVYVWLLRPREQLRSIVMSMWLCLSVCLFVCLPARISPEPHARSLPFLCILPMSVSRSSPGMFTIGRIAYRRERVFFPIEMHHRPGKGDRSAQRGRSMLSTIVLFCVAFCRECRLVSKRYVISHFIPNAN